MGGFRRGIVTVLILFASRSSGAQGLPRFSLSTSPNARCATRASLTPYLAAVFGRELLSSSLEETPNAPRVWIDESAGRVLQLRIRLQSSGAARPVLLQTLTAPRRQCTALLASVASTLRDHLIPPRPEAPAASSETVIERVQVVVAPSQEQSDRREQLSSSEIVSTPLTLAPQVQRTRFGWQVHLDAYGSVELMPTVAPGTRLGVRLRSAPRAPVEFVVGLAARVDLPVSMQHAQGALESWAVGGDLTLCARWRFLDACALTHLGLSTSQVPGNDARSTARWFVGAQLGGTLRLSNAFGLRAFTELLVSPSRTHQEIARSTVWSSPLFGVVFGLGANLDIL